jgi:hypothetical protein
MPHEFTERPPEPESQPASGGSIRPPGKWTATDLLDPPEAAPPPGLIRKPFHVSFWLGIALLLGALVALVLVGLAVE